MNRNSPKNTLICKAQKHDLGGLSFVLLLALMVAAKSISAGELKVRAREHFDFHKIDRDGRSETYNGLSNTINIWYEKPFDVSYGFAFNPILGGAEAEDSELTEVGDQVRLIHAGFEIKYFFAFERLYKRVGLGWSQLRTKGDLKRSNGYHGYLGLGWEFPVGQMGIAIEVAYRRTEVQNNIDVGSVTPSVGFHFYKF